ncbi:hypothetical protein VQ042_23605 [Aurantimonas sp. A2-1-M11]|uniref:hypothetical protein n=1 Tax=Aurantimonas sp. A2-1-M11 TaxID=3113712 RepID=UPI002F92632D
MNVENEPALVGKHLKFALPQPDTHSVRAGRRWAAAARAEQNQATAETVDLDTGEITDP